MLYRRCGATFLRPRPYHIYQRGSLTQGILKEHGRNLGIVMNVKLTLGPRSELSYREESS